MSKVLRNIRADWDRRILNLTIDSRILEAKAQEAIASMDRTLARSRRIREEIKAKEKNV